MVQGYPINDAVTPTMLIYEHINFKGRTLVVTGDLPNFVTIGFNAKASSAIVLIGNWNLFEHTDYKGKSIILHPGQNDNLNTLEDVLTFLCETTVELG